MRNLLRSAKWNSINLMELTFTSNLPFTHHAGVVLSTPG